MARGTHLGAEHELALRWADLVQELFPSIERVRFTASGTEATMLALRLARAYTGREVVVRFFGHYHGWHDLLARDTETDQPAGVPAALLGSTIVLQQDLEALAATLNARDDIAAVILEPTGASYGMVPSDDAFLRGVRELTAARDVLLICDEVVTGFRVAPGGAQARAGIHADLTTLAKVLAGGLPGGAVGGRADVMHHLDFGDPTWTKDRKIRHNGTFNANPLSAAAGVTTLEHIRDGAIGQQAGILADQLVLKLNQLFQQRDLHGWAAYGNGSIFHLVAGATPTFAPGELPSDLDAATLKRGGDAHLLSNLRMALINHGVDLMRGRSGFFSRAHSPADLDATIVAFDAALGDIAMES
jgi:glutamate-1-semialdehyde 2,1-aminomutase